MLLTCPRCGRRNPEFNLSCQECGGPLPLSSSGGEGATAGRTDAGAEAGPRLEAGRRVGSLRVEALIGRGGMSEVYRAWDETREQAVALKLLRPDKAQVEELRRRLRREARAVRALDHPAIVRLFDVVEIEEGEAIVMELVEGRTLADLLAAATFDCRRAIRLGRELAGGLAAAHARGIVHRDLKTENVMLDAEGRAKILDFGLVKRLPGNEANPSLTASVTASLTAEGGIVGTWRSMSPEQAQARPVDHRSDLFSLGTLLYEVLTGRTPFRGDSLAETLAQICIHRPTPAREVAPTVPAPLSALVDRLLEKDPARRPQSAAEVEAELAAMAAALAGSEDSRPPM